LFLSDLPTFLTEIYNLGSEGEFGKKAIIKGLEVEGFTLKNMRKLGLSTKDCIGPMSFKFEKDYMMIGDKYARALFLSDLPTFLTDNILAELTNTDCNMLTTLNYESIQQDKALRIVQNQMININANVIDKQKRASKAGYSTDLISPELTKAQSEANELLQDLTSKNQKMFLLTIVIVHFADTLEELNKHTEIISSTARKFICRVRVLHYQQENGLNSALPLCNNQLHIKRTLTTESTSIFMPFSSQELMQKEGLYYGLNAVSRNLILLNRKASKNANGFILGTPGSGKSFSAKREMLNVLLNTNDDVIVIDPEREYGPMAEMLGGEVVRIAAGSKYHLNPMDLDSDYADEDDPITLKSDFILSLCESVVGGRYGLDPIQRSIIDRCCRLVYAEYVQDFNPAKLPTLLDFQNLLEAQPEREAREIAIALEIYTRGSLDIFAHHTNVNNTGRFVIYDIKDIGNNIKTMAMLIVLDSIWNRIIQNRKKGKRTWFYIDEIYLLFTNETSATFLQQLYKRARKWGGVPTGITQNVEDLLRSETARTMLSNCEFIQMLNQAPLDRAELAHLLNISNTQLSYITNSASGEGLIYTGSSIVPFVDKFPTDTLMYKAMTTKVDEMKKEFR
jgi:type IV secretory pathway VirB4 component